MTTQSSTWHGDPSTPPSASQRAVAGTQIGRRYTLRAAIGHGGMGTVWQAADTILNRDVAVKEVLLPPGIAVADRTALYERTMREARAAAALSHPSVVQVYDVVTEGGRPWIIMELLHSRSLADMIIADGPLAPRAVAKIGVALLGALEVAHSAGVLHRDVKPANVLICNDGRCVLTDFGVARLPSESTLTTPGMVLGSPHFISPERAVGGAFGPPSDLFSLGVSLYTAIEGRPPFDRGDPFETMRAVVEDPPAKPVRAGALAPILFGLLEKDPNRRWDVHTARQVLRDLLNGPLANSAAHHVTDPYTVVPVAQKPPPVAHAPTGQVGGRAMIAPGQPLPGRQAGPVDAATTQITNPGAVDPWRAAAETQVTSAQAGTRAVLEPTNPGLAQLPEPRGSRHSHASGSGGLVGDLAAGAKAAADSLTRRVRTWPRRLQYGVAGGVVVVILLITALAAGWLGGGQPAVGHQAGPAPSASNAPLIPDPELYKDDRGFALNVPSSWKATHASSYTEFTDPDDPGRKLRVNVEKAGGTAEQFLVAAEKELKTHPSKCPAPYSRVAIREVTLDGRTAAELEYTCGTGDKERHGLWRATVLNKKAYEFFLSVEDSKLDESRAIYLEAVRSYNLTVG